MNCYSTSSFKPCNYYQSKTLIITKFFHTTIENPSANSCQTAITYARCATLIISYTLMARRRGVRRVYVHKRVSKNIILLLKTLDCPRWTDDYPSSGQVSKPYISWLIREIMMVLCVCVLAMMMDRRVKAHPKNEQHQLRFAAGGSDKTSAIVL